MFAPNCVGTANATTAGWGNLGGGVTQFVMPFLFTTCIALFGLTASGSWRVSMVIAGSVCFLTGIAYYYMTQDTPEGNFKDLRARGVMPPSKNAGSFLDAARDHRVWALFVLYAACFGIELTLNNVLALYFADYFSMGLKTAGLAAAAFGLMNLFARTLGGYFGDVFGKSRGLQGRVTWLFVAVFVEGLFLMLFSQTTSLTLAIPALILFSLFVQMSEGATFSVVPFVNRKSLGSVAGIVGAGGNAGAVAAGFLFKSENLPWPTALFILGAAVTAASFAAFAVRFSPEARRSAAEETDAAEASAAEQRREGSLVPAGM